MITKIKVEELKEWDLNPRKISDESLERLAESIQRNPEFLSKRPLLVKKTQDGLIVYAGNQRLKVIKQLGWEEADCIVDDNITEEKMREEAMIDNVQWGELVLSKLPELNLDADFLKMLDISLDSLKSAEEKDDVIPTDVKSETNTGDLYVLGTHRVLCGDSTKKEDIDNLMGGVLADMVFTDPPYNVNYESASFDGYSHGKFKSNKVFNDNLSDEKFLQFLTSAFSNLRSNIKKGAAIYIFHATKSQKQFEEAINKNGMYVKSTIVWNKPSLTLGWGDYKWKHEPCFYVGVSGEETKWYGGYDKTSVVDFHQDIKKLIRFVKMIKKLENEGKTTIWNVKRDNLIDYKHPTQKPVELICFALTNSSKSDDIVVDTFGGSGSTLIACEKMGRTAYLNELDPRYVDVIIQRWVDYTGNENIIKNGKPIIWKKTETTE